MDTKIGSFLRKSWLLRGFWVVLLAAVLGYLIWLGYRPDASRYTGFGHTPIPDPNTTATGKFLWDWLQLLIFPLVVAGLGTAVSLIQKNTEQKISSDKDNETALESFMDSLFKLALENNLAEIEPPVRLFLETKVHNLARRLDGYRKGLLLQFLYKTELTRRSSPLISLENADFARADLKSMILVDQDFTGISLAQADMTDGIFYGSDFYFADLTGARLVDAKINDSNLTAATLDAVSAQTVRLERSRLATASLREAHLEQANLTSTDLSRANLEQAHLHEAVLTQANLQEANLQRADLRRADLSGADLRKANLSRANLRGANLEGANLDGAILDGAKF